MRSQFSSPRIRNVTSCLIDLTWQLPLPKINHNYFQQFKSHIFFQKSNFNFNLCPLFSSSPGAVKSPNPKRDIPLDRLDLAASIERGQPWQRPLGISCLCRRTLWSSYQSSVPKAEAAWGRHGRGCKGCKGCTGRSRLTLRSGFIKDALH